MDRERDEFEPDDEREEEGSSIPEDLETPPPFFPTDIGREGFAGTPVAVRVEGVYSTEEAGTIHRFVQLEDDSGRVLPISIGPYEAMAIHIALENSSVSRPLTHDLMKTLLDRVDVELDRVVIDDLWNSTYYAKLYLRKGAEEIEVDCRPSDAIALALRTGSGIFVLDSILESYNEGE